MSTFGCVSVFSPNFPEDLKGLMVHSWILRKLLEIHWLLNSRLNIYSRKSGFQTIWELVGNKGKKEPQVFQTTRPERVKVMVFYDVLNFPWHKTFSPPQKCRENNSVYDVSLLGEVGPVRNDTGSAEFLNHLSYITRAKKQQKNDSLSFTMI